MKHETFRLRLGAGGLLALSLACAVPLPAVPVGADAQVTPDGLYKVKYSRMELAWVKPDVTLSGYDKFVLDPVQVSYRHRKGEYELSIEELDGLRATASTIFREAVTSDGRYPIVDAPAPGVLRVSASILDLQISVPETKAGRGNTYGYEPTKMTLLVELRDAMSGEILARAADRSRGSALGMKYDVVSAKGELRQALERWAAIMREGLDDLRTRRTPTPP